MYEEEGYQKGRDYDPNRERAEARRLQRQLKQEAAAAPRASCLKDNAFLASEEAPKPRRPRRSAGRSSGRRWRSWRRWRAT